MRHAVYGLVRDQAQADSVVSSLRSAGFTGSDISVLSLNFFVNNAYLIDFENHRLGVKNN